MKRFIIFSLLCLAWAFSHASFSATKIRFGVIYFYPPFVFSSKSGYIHGFDIELAKAICQQLNAECSFTAMPLAKAFQSLKNNNVDAVMGAISITPLRQTNFAFSRPYLKSTMSYVTLGSTVDVDVNNLKGQRVGVVKDSTFFVYLTKKYGNAIKVRAYNTNEELTAALSNHEVDVVLLDTPAAKYWVNYSAGLFKLLGTPTFLDFDEGYGIAMQKNNIGLVNAINGALNKIISSGQLEKIKQAYFSNKQ